MVMWHCVQVVTHRRWYQRVSISTPSLGRLSNRVRLATECPPWTYGASHLIRDLAKAGLL